jgi:hypothetical protein
MHLGHPSDELNGAIPNLDFSQFCARRIGSNRLSSDGLPSTLHASGCPHTSQILRFESYVLVAYT